MKAATGRDHSSAQRSGDSPPRATMPAAREHDKVEGGRVMAVGRAICVKSAGECPFRVPGGYDQGDKQLLVF